MNQGMNSLPSGTPGSFQLVPRFDATRYPAKYAWLGKLVTETVDQLTNRTSTLTGVSVAYSSVTQRAVMIDAAGASAFSNDNGVTWAAGGALPAGTWFTVKFGNGLFVAFNNDGVNNACATSADGVVWTARTLAANLFQDAAFGNAVWVAAVGGGATFTSADAITWAAGGAIAANTKYLAFGAGVFVAAGNGAGFPYTSTNGAAWTSRAARQRAGSSGLAFGNGKFVWIGLNTGGGTIYDIAVSTDGIIWNNSFNNFYVSYSSNSVAGNSTVVFGNGLFALSSGDGVSVCADGVFNRPPTPYGKQAANSMNIHQSIIWAKDRLITLNGTAAASNVFTSDPLAQDLIYVP